MRIKDCEIFNKFKSYQIVTERLYNTFQFFEFKKSKRVGMLLD